VSDATVNRVLKAGQGNIFTLLGASYAAEHFEWYPVQSEVAKARNGERIDCWL
jgi:hypothetical protein